MAFIARWCLDSHIEVTKRTLPFKGKRCIRSSVGGSVAMVDETQFLIQVFLLLAITLSVHEVLTDPESNQSLELLPVTRFDLGHLDESETVGRLKCCLPVLFSKKYWREMGQLQDEELIIIFFESSMKLLRDSSLF
jgi:hypothetical protein